jgi:uncharacterized glyoxalase superfamily protein PhnB
MLVKGITPILNVSDLSETFAWFDRLGWTKAWEWGDPPTFASVCSGEVQIFLCQGGQGGRGKSTAKSTSPLEDHDDTDRGMWMSLWVDDVDAVHQNCLSQGIEVTFPPTDMPWNVREMHVRHPDGHVFRIGKGIEENQEE